MRGPPRPAHPDCRSPRSLPRNPTARLLVATNPDAPVATACADPLKTGKDTTGVRRAVRMVATFLRNDNRFEKRLHILLARRENAPKCSDQPIELDWFGVKIVAPGGERFFTFAR